MIKGTTIRGIRIGDELWTEFSARTKAVGLNASAVIRQLMRDWLKANKQGEK